jgi:hypothetical protein
MTERLNHLLSVTLRFMDVESLEMDSPARKPGSGHPA